MCGIIFLYGASAGERVSTCIDQLKHRGPDDIQTWIHDKVALGFARLAINGKEDIGKQPYFQYDWIAVVNGEIYNHKKLNFDYKLKVDSSNDTNVVLPLFNKLGPPLIHELDGFYAGLFFNRTTSELYVIRDYMGKKPLFFGSSDKQFFITSELKAVGNVDWFKSVPKGITRIDIVSKKIIEVVKHKLKASINDIVTSLYNAVEKRLPEVTVPIGLFLSGGLDSSIIAAIVSKYRKDAICFILGGKDNPDYGMAIKVAKSLGLDDVRTINVSSGEEFEKDLKSVVYTTESFNPSIVSNGLATYLLAQAAKAAGLKIVLTGEGADELFGGYYSSLQPDEFQSRREQLISDMYFTELRRLDLSTMAHSIEARCPFLDKEIVSLSTDVSFSDIYSEGANKVILREKFRNLLPQEVIDRPKMSFDVGSGIRGEVVQYLRRNGKSEREELYNIWKCWFEYMPTDKYFESYPVFDAAIDVRESCHR